MTIRYKTHHQQFYSLYISFSVAIILLFISFYLVFKVKTNQLTELSPKLLNLFGIEMSYYSFYIIAILMFVLSISALVYSLFLFNKRWQHTHISNIEFVHTCIAYYENALSKKYNYDEELIDEIEFSEQEAIADFFITLKTSRLNEHIHSNINLKDESINTAIPPQKITTELTAKEESNALHNVILPSLVEKAEKLIDIESIDSKRKEQMQLQLNELQNKIIQLMLQNQTDYLVKNNVKLKGYHQLKHLLTRVNDTQLTLNLPNEKESEQHVTTCLQSQLLACIHNVSQENTAQKIPIQFFDKLPALFMVNVDVNTLNSIVSNTFNLMTSSHENSHIKLTISCKEQQTNYCNIRYQFNLFSNEETVQIPREINELITSDLATTNATVNNIRLLFQSINVSNALVKQEDTGYFISFTIQHSFEEQPISQTSSSLKLNSLYLTNYTKVNYTDNIYTHQIVHDALSIFDGELILTNDIEDAMKSLTISALSVQKIQFVIVHDINTFDVINQLIRALPKVLRPTIHLLQDSCKYLTEYASGVTPKLSSPFDKHQFIDELQASLQVKTQQWVDHSKKKITEINSVNLEKLGYITEVNEHWCSTFVTGKIKALVTLTVGSSLIKLLELMGFEVTVTANKEELSSLWKTGQYSLLFCDDDVSPIIDITNGKQIKRAVAFSNKTLLDDWETALKQQPKPWSFIHLPKDFDLVEFKENLSFWLKLKENEINRDDYSNKPVVKNAVTEEIIRDEVIVNVPIEIKSDVDEINSGGDSLNKSVVKNDGTEEVDHDEVIANIQIEINSDIDDIDDIDDLLKLEPFTDVLDIFNIGEFTDNQISPEYSIFLLEEYTEENNQLFNSVSKMLIEKNYIESCELLKKLRNNAKVLSASNLVNATTALITAIETKNHQQVQLLVDGLEEQVMLFTEVIEY